MIVDGIGRHELDDGRVARTATVRQGDGSTVPISTIVPAEFDPPEPDDATGVLPLALLLAMRLGEDLEIGGRVDAALLARTDDLQAYYLAAGGSVLREVAVRAEGPLVTGPPRPLAAACLSRGVDSLYQAARRRSAGGELGALLFVDHFEPIHDDAVRAAERRLAAEAAVAIGLPLVIAEAPLRELADMYFDWEDAVGAGLAWVGHALAGGLGRLVIPATDFVQSLAPSGHGPGLDPLFSSGRMLFEPGDISKSRMAKVAWLVRHHPELLPLVKVCYAANRPDNCGRCGKCLHTMACLRAAGALERATAFPPELDLQAFAGQRHEIISVMVEITAVRDAAEQAGDGPLEAAANETLRRSVAYHRAATPGVGSSFRARHSHAIRTLLRDEDDRRDVGLVRAIDLRGRRHLYGAGWLPPGTLTAELGALLPDAAEATIALWVLPDGRVATADVAPAGAQAGLIGRARHVVAPFRRGGGARRAARRAADFALVRPLGPATPDVERPPHGYLYSEPAADRVPVWAGDHPTTGDQYVAASPGDVAAAGYANARLLGHLAARAPLTGRLGVQATTIIPWV